MDLPTFEAHLRQEGYQTLATVSQPPGYHMDSHAHPFDACALVLEGEFSLVVDGVRSRYGVGDIFRLPAGTPHSESAGAQGVTYRAGRRTPE